MRPVLCQALCCLSSFKMAVIYIQSMCGHGGMSCYFSPSLHFNSLDACCPWPFSRVRLLFAVGFFFFKFYFSVNSCRKGLSITLWSDLFLCMPVFVDWPPPDPEQCGKTPIPCPKITRVLVFITVETLTLTIRRLSLTGSSFQFCLCSFVFLLDLVILLIQVLLILCSDEDSFVCDITECLAILLYFRCCFIWGFGFWACELRGYSAAFN